MAARQVADDRELLSMISEMYYAKAHDAPEVRAHPSDTDAVIGACCTGYDRACKMASAPAEPGEHAADTEASKLWADCSCDRTEI